MTRHVFESVISIERMKPISSRGKYKWNYITTSNNFGVLSSVATVSYKAEAKVETFKISFKILK
jgi:hypothetical protein